MQNTFPPQKARLREVLRQRRRSLSAAQQDAAARAVASCAAQLPQWPGARRIALYLAADAELDTSHLVALARDQSRTLFLPVIQEDSSLAFAEWQADSRLTPNRYGIPEPPAQATRCPPAELDILFLPLVGWDRRGGRLGMGGGFYDRTLAGGSRPLLVGLAHSCQEVASIPMENWDIALDFVATETALIRCQGSGG